MTTNFSDQVQLLVQLLPLVAKQSCFVFSQAINLPAIQWKLHNLEKMGDQKRREAVDKLHTLLLG